MADISRIRTNSIAVETDKHASNGCEMAGMRENHSSRPEMHPERNMIWGAVTRGDKELKGAENRHANSEGDTDFVDTSPEDLYADDEDTWLHSGTLGAALGNNWPGALDPPPSGAFTPPPPDKVDPTPVYAQCI